MVERCLVAMAWLAAVVSGPQALAQALPGNPMPPAPAWAFSDREDGLSCAFVDVGLLIPWPGSRPNWTDADGRANGPRPFATDRAEASDGQRVRRIDVSRLVADGWSGKLSTEGFLLRLEEGFIVDFHGREAHDVVLRPQLLLRNRDGRERYVEAAADVTLDCSTYRGLGRAPTLSARRDTWVALRFDMAAASRALGGMPVSAQLILVRTPESRPGSYRMNVYALRLPFGRPQPKREDGIARRYPADRGIGGDADVLFADAFDSRFLVGQWSVGMKADFDLVDEDARNGFEPLGGRALRVTIPRDKALGLDLRYRFRERHGSEPGDVYFRYYLRLAPSWLRASEGGKLPGLAGTYGKVGWGGRGWDGQKGWSARGGYSTPLPPGHPAHGKTALSSYVYHSQATAYGDGMGWIGSGFIGLIEPNRWYCLEQRVRLNTPGQDDGLLQAWIDGRPVLDRQGLRFRDVDAVRIEEVWMNFFHGGTRLAPADMHAYVDHVVIARRYIGPLAGGGGEK